MSKVFAINIYKMNDLSNEERELFFKYISLSIKRNSDPSNLDFVIKRSDPDKRVVLGMNRIRE